MPKRGERKDLTGMRFGRLLVESEAAPVTVFSGARIHRYYRWNCTCDCGNSCIVKSQELLAGKTVSCGCFANEKRLANRKTHGLSKTRLYRVYTGMKTRCYNKRDPHYHSYGGRGIRICDEWLHDFKSFYDWALSNGYDPDASPGACSIDRIDVDGDYSPDNCRFITMSEQAYNKTDSHLIYYKGEMVPISKVAKLEGISEKTIFSRVYRGQDPLKDIRKTRRSYATS